MPAAMKKAVPALLAPLALAACGPGENAPGPGGVTVGEARALDRAAEIIEERRLPPEALAPLPAPAPVPIPAPAPEPAPPGDRP